MNVHSRRRDHRGEPPANIILATLVPRWTGGHYGYLYDVVLDGETIVAGSHDPGHDACRVLFGRGKTGRIMLVDAGGARRVSFDILRAAFLTVSEEDRKGLRLRHYREAPAKGGGPKREADKASMASEIANGHTAAHASTVRQWERDDAYPHVVHRLGEDWRIVACRDDIQWIVQRRAGSAWRSTGHCRSRSGLQAMLRRSGLDPAAVHAFPETYPEGQRTASTGEADTSLRCRDRDAGERAA